MEHDFAVSSMAVERYFLGDMSDGEMMDFEQHYFECEICAEDVRVTSTLAEVAAGLT